MSLGGFSSRTPSPRFYRFEPRDSVADHKLCKQEHRGLALYVDQECRENIRTISMYCSSSSSTSSIFREPRRPSVSSRSRVSLAA